jgi:PAS domain S-box-containing protein
MLHHESNHAARRTSFTGLRRRPGSPSKMAPEVAMELARLRAENRVLKVAMGRKRVSSLPNLQAGIESEERYRQVIDASPVPLSVDDMRGRIEFINRKFVEKFGYTHSEIPTSAEWMLRAYPNPEYRRHVTGRWRTFISEGLRGRKAVGPLEVEVTCKDGSTKRVEFMCTRVENRLLVAANDITERERLEKQILEISEKEQERIGQDLHDGLCQLLSGIKFKTTLLEQKLKIKAPDEALAARAIESLLNGAIEQARNMAKGLHPVDIEARGLMSALEGLAASVSSLYGIQCQCVFRRQVLVHDHAVAIHLYRIAQEAITNAVKHAQARNIRIALAGDPDRLTLTVDDDGVGLLQRISRRKRGMGLHLMDYRARSIGAHLEFGRAPIGGTRVTCRWHAAPKPQLTLSYARQKP